MEAIMDFFSGWSFLDILFFFWFVGIMIAGAWAMWATRERTDWFEDELEDEATAQDEDVPHFLKKQAD